MQTYTSIDFGLNPKITVTNLNIGTEIMTCPFCTCCDLQ